MTERLLHFTLGPVQGFVAQARRTRDLWAGSFLLSWLAGHAMKVVAENDGTILVPDVRQDPLFEAMTNGVGRFGPAVGSLPNRFKAKVSKGFDPVLCREAIDKAWRGLAGRVWQRFVAPIADQGHGTQAIWDRQVKSYWETVWVIGPDTGNGEDHVWLDRRKNWRTHRPAVEGGDHCMLMGEWQELSGFIRSRERKKQDEFWRALKAHVDQASENPLQLDENERLCAMALVKRLFPHVAKNVLGWTPSWDSHRPLRWPSTPRLAAAGWLRHAWQEAPTEAAAFVETAKGTKGEEPPLDAANSLSQAPGALLHRSGIENAHPGELAGTDGNAEAIRSELLEAHEALTKKVGEPSPFYALLLMDGDKVGALLRINESAVTLGLAGFSRKVDAAVRGNGGNTIYAGGDDVLALLPLEGALPTALALRDAYRGAFPSTADATISAAVVFCHFHVPLRHVLREAHRQLDEAAKDGNGRDSLAVCVRTQSGVTREWVSTWGTDPASPPQVMIDVAQDIDERISGRFFYAIREQYDDVISGDVLDLEDIRSILLAEYRRSEAGAGLARNDVGKRMDRLFTLAERHATRGSPHEANAPLLSMEGPLIASFLARETRRA